MHDTKRARHSQMHQEHLARPKLGQKVLRPASHATNHLPLEPIREIGRKVVAEVRAPRDDTPDAGPGHGTLQAPPLIIDLGQFWHSL